MKHYQIKAGELTFNIEEYGSAFEVVETNRKRTVTPQWKGHSLGDVRKGFHGVESKDEAHRMLRDGWTKDLGKMTTLLNSPRMATTTKRAAFKNDVIGFAPIVPLAMMNVPNSMINTALKPVKSKVVKIFYVMSDSAYVEAEKFKERGQKVLEAVMSLEQSGYRCELYSAQFYVDGPRCDGLLVKVKEANQPLDVKRVMFPFMHPAMFRVIGFEWQDKCPSAIYQTFRGGPFHSRVSNHKKVFREAFGDDYVYIDASIADEGADEIARAIKERKGEV